MKKSFLVSDLMIVLVAGLLICSFIDFLAYTDIFHDYVSKTVIQRFSPDVIRILPWWTDTSGEWSLANTSFFIRVILIVLLLFLTVRRRIAKM
ncbi:MAG TPA: hypothetical protein VK207_11570 [Bacteroidales bacterium]|nr:hypothetical protein [Bacteroidales bacterium]